MPGHNSKLNFWYDCWSDLGPLRNLIQGPLPHETENLKISDVCSTSGWEWSTIPFEFPLEIKAIVQAVPTPIFARSGDKLAWKFSPKGDFDARSAYLLASDYQDTNTTRTLTLLMAPGFGSFVPSQKSKCSCGNAYIRP